MWRPLFLYYFLLIATMTKTMFVNSQQLLFIIRLYVSSLLSRRSIWPLLFFLLCLYFTLHLYHKNTKNIILSYLSNLTLVSDLVGIDNPLSCWLRGFICLCRCEGLVRGLLLDWYLGSQKLREILTLLYYITLSSSRENQRSAQEVARVSSRALTSESVPS